VVDQVAFVMDRAIRSTCRSADLVHLRYGRLLARLSDDPWIPSLAGWFPKVVDFLGGLDMPQPDQDRVGELIVRLRLLHGPKVPNRRRGDSGIKRPSDTRGLGHDNATMQSTQR
jgi:hypothetical protein